MSTILRDCILHLSLHSDQFCSLVYSLSNLYFVGCFYSRYFPYVPSSNGTSTSGSSIAVVSRFFSSQTSSLVPRDNAIWSAYDPAVQDAWHTCGTQINWGSYFVLAIIPFVVRLVQSLRRYKDSKLPTHLINVSLHYRMEVLRQLTSGLNVQAGKYGMGIVYYFCYYLWRRDGRPPSRISILI